MSLQQILVATGGAAAKLFDSFSTSHLGIWSLQKERTDYTGYAVRAGLAADSGATTLDIGFLADGSFDMTTYSAFGTGSERIVTWYDQSSNGFDLSRAWDASLCPIIRTSSYNSKPCVYFATGSLGNSGFTDWNGLADAHFITATNLPTAQYTGYVFVGGSGLRGLEVQPDRTTRWWERWSTVYNEFTNQIIHSTSGHIYHAQYDGGAATNALKGRIWMDNIELSSPTIHSGFPSTLDNETGLWINALSNGTSGVRYESEYFTFYYLGLDISSGDRSRIYNALQRDYYTFTQSNIVTEGDSLTFGGTSPNKWPDLVAASLASTSGHTWNLTNISSPAETAAFMLGQQTATQLRLRDRYKRNDVLVFWAGTNDLAGAAGGSGDVTTLLTNVAAYCQNAFNEGFSVYCCNVIARTGVEITNPTFEADRLSYNSQLAGYLTGIATLVDLSGIPALQNTLDTTYFLPDQTHLTDAGRVVVASAVAAAIEPNIV